MDKLKIYLDNCCYNRPFDDQTRARIAVETQAKLIIQSLVKTQRVELIWSFVLVYENELNPHINKKIAIRNFAKNAKIWVYESDIITTGNDAYHGIKKMDALHLASAKAGGADFFITTDDKLLKYHTTTRIVSPPDFITLWMRESSL